MNLRRFLPVLTLGMLLASGVFAAEPQEIVKLVKQGQYTQALERADRFLAANPKDAQVRFQKGLILAELGRSSDAIRVFTQLSEDYPELPEPYNNLAVLYASQNQLDKARQALEMAIQTHPSYAVAHENLGDIYAKMASQAYDKALQLDKNNAGALTKLSLIRELFSKVPATPKAPAAPAAAAPSVVAAAPAPVAKPPAVAAPVKPIATQAAAPAPLAAAKPAATPIKPIAVAEAPKPAEKPLEKIEKPVEKAKEQPAKTPEPAKPATGSDDADEVISSVNGWAKAWAGQKVPAYLGYYAKSFQPPKGESRSSWEAARKDRISRPKSIDVSVDAPKVKFNDDGRAVVSFTQHYRSDSLKTSTGKTLVLAKNNGKWLIVEERVGR